ncbi:hypothetical protein [Pseudomonas aeruginosa]|uniref:hypothetical protein n=1 Tax=Pseudomonas aeruginosa TaxID=287 RepID=UPI001049B868|nr:hypothetical protein [Pseudomonas aeruginosa]
MEIDYSKIEQQTRLLVDYINQNPDLFFDNNLNMVVIPYEINLLAKEYASDKKEALELVGQYSRFLDSQDPVREAFIPSGREFYALPEDLNGMTPRKASELFDRATSSVAEGLSEIRAFAANHARMRTFNSELFFEDSKDIDKSIYSDFYCPKI